MASSRILSCFSKSRNFNRLIFNTSKFRSLASKPRFRSRRRHSREGTTCCVGQNTVEFESKLHGVLIAKCFRHNLEQRKCRVKVYRNGEEMSNNETGRLKQVVDSEVLLSVKRIFFGCRFNCRDYTICGTGIDGISRIRYIYLHSSNG